MPRLQGFQQRFGRVFLGLHHHPAAKVVRFREMRVIRGHVSQHAVFRQQQVRNVEPFAPVAAGGAAVIVDFNRMGGVDAAGVRQGQARPMRMRNSHKCPGFTRAAGNLGPCLLAIHRREIGRMGGREICRQANRQHVPQLPVLHCAGVDPGARNGGENLVPEGGGIGDGVIVAADKMVGQRDEVITLCLVAAADFCRFQNSVRQGGMGVQVAPVKLARGGGGVLQHEDTPVL